MRRKAARVAFAITEHATMWKTRRLRPRPADVSPEAPFRDRSCLRAAPSFGQPRPISRLGRAGRPYRPCFPHRHAMSEARQMREGAVREAEERRKVAALDVAQ
eukprot:scaffold33833_cov49-Phaeocystis_antarctica.AAC.1